MSIAIPHAMLVHYIEMVADGHIATYDCEPETVDGYASDVDEMIRQTRLHRDEGVLQLGIEYLLGHPEIDTEPFVRKHYFDDASIRPILRYIHERAWSGQPIPVMPPDVRLVEQPLMEWWARKDRPKTYQAVINREKAINAALVELDRLGFKLASREPFGVREERMLMTPNARGWSLAFSLVVPEEPIHMDPALDMVWIEVHESGDVVFVPLI